MLYLNCKGVIFLVIPVAFAILMETESEYEKLERATNGKKKSLFSLTELVAAGKGTYTSF
jgi:hypothetical protein